MSVRCFVAIELPDDVHALFSQVGESIRAADQSWCGEKWVPRENLHITLKFVGHVAEESVGTLVAACLSEMAGLPGFEILPDSVRAVPSPKRARMLWGSFTDPSGGCADLAAAAERAALQVGADPDERAFKPHVTLVRARTPRRISPPALEEGNLLVKRFETGVSVTAATVFHSTLGRSGPTYTALATCPLAG